jgi:5-methylcytosine-specific restriction protein A
MPRAFRTAESLAEEKTSRDLVAPFLENQGFRVTEDRRRSHGPSESQTIVGVSPEGAEVSLRVKLCWRLGRSVNSRGYSAAQLVANVKSGNWQEGLESFVGRLHHDGVTHLLLLQRDGDRFSEAAWIPLDANVPVWVAQRDESDRLIASKGMGRRTKNHAVNGGSPTLWLRDDIAPSVVEKLWNHPGVADLVRQSGVAARTLKNDTLDDLVGFDPDLLGRDAGQRALWLVSGIARDSRVRKAVLVRSNGACECCGGRRDYQGFLDVHHILGAETSDRTWSCVALCPNCHRDTHFAANRDELNDRLLEFAEKFRENFSGSLSPDPSMPSRNTEMPFQRAPQQ